MSQQDDGKTKETGISKTSIVAWVLFVFISIWFIFFLLSVPSITEYCEPMRDIYNNPCYTKGFGWNCTNIGGRIFVLPKTAWLGINIWEKEGCERYWEAKYETEEIGRQYNISITFKDLNNQQIENLTNSTRGACGLYIKKEIIVRLNRTNCGSVNQTITHELKHHKCGIMGFKWHNDTDAHQGCFLNIIL